MKKRKIPAVYKEDLISLLKAVNEYEEVLEGNRYCKICQTPIFIENIQLILPEKDSQFSYICTSIECIEQYQQLE